MPQASKTVVCIEDEPGVIELIQLILEQRGLQVVGAETGAEGLSAIRELRPALVLLDLMLPEMDGWEVYKQMKADAALKSIPVVIVTAKTAGIDEALAKHVAKVDAYIKKPFSLEELVQSVDRALSGATAPSS
jgi:two-component system response regulator VicR